MAEAYDASGAADNPFREWLGLWEASGLPDEDHRYRTRIDVGEFLDKRRASLLAHRTQIDPDGFWMQVSDEQIRAHHPFEEFKLVQSRVPVHETVIETDLFTGVDQ
jgi:mycothiol S-conjugate amidase